MRRGDEGETESNEGVRGAVRGGVRVCNILAGAARGQPLSIVNRGDRSDAPH